MIASIGHSPVLNISAGVSRVRGNKTKDMELQMIAHATPRRGSLTQIPKLERQIRRQP
jgi:hypothetical protein